MELCRLQPRSMHLALARTTAVLRNTAFGTVVCLVSTMKLEQEATRMRMPQSSLCANHAPEMRPLAFPHLILFHLVSFHLVSRSLFTVRDDSARLGSACLDFT